MSFGQTIDQSNGTTLMGGYVNVVNATNALGQSITAGVTGSMTKIKVRVKNESSTFVAGSFQMRIFSGNGYGGTLLNTTTFPISTAPTSSGWDELDITLSSPLDITSGNFYTLDFKGIGSANVNMHSTGNNYANGGYYFNQDNFSYGNSDLWFRTYVIAAPDPCWTTIAAGSYHNLAIAQNGTLWAWGENNYGQLGDNTTTNRIIPTQIGTSADWSSIAGGLYHSLAIKTDGTLWTWGYNGNGELGDNTTTDKIIPTQIGVATNWYSIVGGTFYSLAIKTDGTLWAWGANSSGQLGDNTTTSKIIPTQIGVATNWSSIAGGAFHSLAIKTNGTLWTWGYNGDGQLGDNTTTDKIIPTQIGAATNWSSLAAGGFHSLAIKTDGTLWAWGRNYYGQLGGNTITEIFIPTQIGTATNWYSIAGGTDHSLAVKTDGTLWAWGRNYYGQLGDNTTTDKIIPTQIGAATNWSSVSGGSFHSLATKKDHALWAWGYNGYGQLGDGTSADKNIPTDIDCPAAILSITNFDVSENIIVYPNPTNGNVNIMVNNLTNVSVSVYDLNGRTILNKELSANENTVDISNFQTGMYLFRIKSSEGEVVKKVIKN